MGTRKRTQAEREQPREARRMRATKQAREAHQRAPTLVSVAPQPLHVHASLAAPSATHAAVAVSISAMPAKLATPVTTNTYAPAVARPGHGATSGHHHFGELRTALAEGWEIVQPIFARPLWSAADDSATAFNFVLHGPHGTRLITVPQGRLVDRFIRDRRLSVDYAR